ncbi:hypothetical protein BC828DRAFT_254584 [Blastocladiella britannica]|nr:hypothetical protein BC828DRAFT_254584 [Blastocladiella britannica]
MPTRPRRPPPLRLRRMTWTTTTTRTTTSPVRTRPRRRRSGNAFLNTQAGRKPTSGEPSDRRKAQNRAAQRAFRERKERYIRELETRVKELEDLTKVTDAATLQLENAQLRALVQKLEAENYYLKFHAASFTGNAAGRERPMCPTWTWTCCSMRPSSWTLRRWPNRRRRWPWAPPVPRRSHSTRKNSRRAGSPRARTRAPTPPTSCTRRRSAPSRSSSCAPSSAGVCTRTWSPSPWTRRPPPSGRLPSRPTSPTD